ncbi:AIM24 family protein [Paraburkholderia phosphatilytica]|uniref:AIM24 family protein n=1 Tax=Paraburkholderia phosphatilytica TaxID=2282883 RepID=UPI000E53A00D|nr:AIM24 family protein [Paraburkholderia phosphatilytica]
MNQQLPRLLPTSLTDETFGGVTYHIGGELVPVLSVDVSRCPVYFEHHILLWKHSNVRIGIRPVKGAVKRMLAGMQVFITEASGDGIIAFSRDGAGHIVPIHLGAGQELHVREHQFLAATSNIEYTFERVRGITNMLFGQTGFFIDRFRGHDGDGVLWLHGYGNVFEKVLAAGETIDIEPGGWLYKDPQVQMDTVVDRLSSGLFGAGFNFIVNRFTGPGRVGIQSMYVNNATDER